MPESRQALLFDRARATHVLAEVGGTIEGYFVEDIDDDEVTLRRDGTQIVLVAPPRDGGYRDGELGVHVRSAAAVRPTDTAGELAPVDPYLPYGPYASAAAVAPVDPYASSGTTGASGASAPVAPVDPYAEPAIRSVRAPDAPERERAAVPATAIEPGEGGVRVVRAPTGAVEAAGSTPAGAADPAVAGRPRPPGEGGVRVVEAPDAAAHPGPSTSDAARTSAGKPADRRAVDAAALADVLAGDGRAHVAPPASPGAPARTPAADAAAAPTPTAASGAPHTVALSRGEVDGALANFGALATAIRASFSASGLVVERVHEASLFYRAGLRAGDVVTAVDGARLRTLDDAANLYARAATARAITAQVVRSGKPVTLHVMIQ